MSWLGWTLCGYFALNALAAVAMVGKQREPIQPGAAVIHVLLSAGQIAVVVAFWPTP